MILTQNLNEYIDNLFSYYVNINPSFIGTDEDANYRLVGFSPTPSGSLTSPVSYSLVLNFPVPIRRGSLNSATLSFYTTNTLPSTITTLPGDLNPSVIEDPRQPILTNSTGLVVPINLSTLFFNDIVSDYSTIISSEKVIVLDQEINKNSTIQIDVTSFLQYHTNSLNWLSGNNIPLIISGQSVNNSSVGAIDISSLVVTLDYKVVFPDKPINLSVSESAYKQISVSWLEPDNGGDTIQKYIMQSGDLETNIWINIAETSSKSVTIDNLNVGVPFYTRVAAQNSAGIGSFAISSQSITLSKNLAPVTALSFNDANLTRIRVRRASSSEWNSANPILAIGEIAYETNSNRLKIGNGVSFWSGLPYVTIDQNSINFPDPPEVFLKIASSEFNLPNNDRIILNLSNNNSLNIIGKEGVIVNYDNDFKSLIFSVDKLYNPIRSGTIFNPTSSGTAGSLLYDNDWLYFCVNNNSWERSPIDKSWINFSTMFVSGSNNIYTNNSNLIFNQETMIFNISFDPYPALAGRPLTNTEARNFTDISIVPTGSTFQVLYRGGTNTSNPMIVNNDDYIGIMLNGTPVKSFNLGTGILPGFVGSPSGFTFNFDVQNRNRLFADDCGGYPDALGRYSYRDGRFLKQCWSISDFYSSNYYFSSSNYESDYFRDNNGHSKILGFCLDGYPIYGPYGYTDPLDSTSPIILMKSSYIILEEDSHRPINWKFNNTIVISNNVYSLLPGIFVEDFIYTENYGTLDQYNGRFCITPEFPNGTYAYFLTFTDSSLDIPEFPYIIGPNTKEQRNANV